MTDMFASNYEPDLSPGELADDVSKDEFCPASHPLSRRISHLDDKVGERGWQDKFNIKMVVQVGLSIYYAIIYGLSFTGLNAFYAWPLESSTSTTTSSSLVVGIHSVLTNEEEFYCSDKTFYLNGTGPLLDYESSGRRISYDNGAYDILVSMGVYWGISIAFFVAIIVYKLYQGVYNQLLLIVKFREDEKDGKLKPAKLSFAYTIMCNAKSFSNVVFQDLCDRMWSDASVDFPDNFRDWLAWIFLACWAFLMCWIFLLILTCGDCCGLLSDRCRIFQRGPRFRGLRLLVIINTVVMLLTWVVNFDPSFEFNPRYPVLFATNIVSWIDLVVSLIGDVYLKFGCCSNANNVASQVRPDHDVEEAVPSDGAGERREDDHAGVAPPTKRHSASASRKREEQRPVVYCEETIDPNGNRKSVETTIYPDGSRKVVERLTTTN